MRVSREELHILAGATREPRLVARLFARSLIAGRELDVQIAGTGSDTYTVTVSDLAYELVVSETVLSVAFRDIEEGLKLGLLSLFCEQILMDSGRRMRRADAAAHDALRQAALKFGPR